MVVPSIGMKTPFLAFPNIYFSTFNNNNSIVMLLLLLLFTLIHSTGAQSSPPHEDEYDPNYYRFSPRLSLIITGIIISLFILSSLTLCLCCIIQGPSNTEAGWVERSAQRRKGLDLTIIESFPTFDYSAVKNLHIGRGALECAVCLNEFEDDEILRLIPKCDHVFHPECIDVWLNGHTTCPVCRADLTPGPDESVHGGGFELIGQTNEVGNYHGDVVVDVSYHGDVDAERSQHQICCDGEESREKSLHGAAARTSVESGAYSSTRLNRTRRINVSAAVGWPVWFDRFSSNSTGHILMKQQQLWENYTLRVPEEVRKQIMSGKLNRQCFVGLACPPARRGNHFCLGDDGSCRGGRLSVSSNPRYASKSDGWALSRALPFISSRRSTKMAAVSVHGGNNKGDKEANVSGQLPV